jgi:addiction module HigA family antidote
LPRRAPDGDTSPQNPASGYPAPRFARDAILPRAFSGDNSPCASASSFDVAVGLLLACYFCNKLHEAAEDVTNNPGCVRTPGEMLKEEFLVERLSQNELAKVIGISPNRIAQIVNNRRRITADTALRLSLYFGNSPEFWMNLQTHHDLKIARQNLDAKDITRIKAQRAA